MKAAEKILTLIALILSASTSLFSQNLVHNPSFECGIDLCGPTLDPFQYGNYACYWTCPTLGTSDVLSTAIQDKSCFLSTPNDGSLYHPGSQSPRTGNRFAGIITYDRAARANDTTYREYIQVTLKEPLIEGEYYCVEMFVSFAGHSQFACNNLGMFFSDFPTLTPDYFFIGALPYTSQIVEKAVITDSTNWVKVSGIFKATAGLQYLTIGNFSENYQTDTLNNPNFKYDTNYLYEFAYYFIDDVSVEHLPQKEFIYTGDTEICKGDATTIKIEGFDDVVWTTLKDTVTVLSTNDSLFVRPQVTTQYRVVVKNCNLTLKDTITVTVDTFLKVNLGRDTTICAGSAIRLNAGVLLGSIYNWQDGSSDQYLTVNQAGKYSVSVSNPFNDCVGQDDINISIKEPPKIELGKDTIVCKEFFRLKAGHDRSLSYLWSNGSVDSVFIPRESGKYWVTVRNRCGQATDSISVFSSQNIFVPNVITLNDDLLNNDFRFAVLDKDQKLDLTVPVEGKLVVYNRWGEEIFFDNDYQFGWPSQTTEIDQGVYYFTFNYRNCSILKGWLHLLK